MWRLAEAVAVDAAVMAQGQVFAAALDEQGAVFVLAVRHDTHRCCDRLRGGGG